MVKTSKKNKKANKLLLENERGGKKKDEKNCLTCVGSSKPK